MTPKKYKLLRDLPDGSKPGDIYVPMESSDKVYINNSRSGRGKIGWTSVENNPEWFEEVKEPQPIEPPTYTQSEYDKAIEDAFEAARSGDIVPPELGSRLAFGFKHTYPTFKDYQATIKQ